MGRANTNLFLSLSIGLLGMFGAVLNDDIGPVRRAASAGMHNVFYLPLKF